MHAAERRRANLARLLDLCQACRGWSRRRLARELERDASKLIPGSGIPKLDVVVGIARLLEWSVADVIDRLREGEEVPDEVDVPERSFEDWDALARAAHRAGRWGDLVTNAQRAYAAALTPAERARACNREAGGWDGRGWYSRALEAVRRGLREDALPPALRRLLQGNLANAYYGLRAFTEARAVSGDLIEQFAHRPPVVPIDRLTLAFAHFVSGQTRRRLAIVDRPESASHAASARRDLEIAIGHLAELAAICGDDSYAGIANTCRGALLETEVILGARSAGGALAVLADGLDAVTDCAVCRGGDWLESFGWWCIAGCNVAVRCGRSERRAQRYLAVFTNKADEIAERLDNWSLRERIIAMEYAGWARRSAPRSLGRGRMPACLLDADDVRAVLGTMGRFPSFQSTGWRLLESAGLAYRD